MNALTRYTSIDLVLDPPERNLYNDKAFRFIRIQKECDKELWPLTDSTTKICDLNSEVHRLWPQHMNIVRSDLTFSCSAHVFSEGVIFQGEISEQWILQFIKTIIDGKSIYVRAKPNIKSKSVSHYMITSDPDYAVFANDFLIY